MSNKITNLQKKKEGRSFFIRKFPGCCWGSWLLYKVMHNSFLFFFFFVPIVLPSEMCRRSWYCLDATALLCYLYSKLAGFAHVGVSSESVINVNACLLVQISVSEESSGRRSREVTSWGNEPVASMSSELTRRTLQR